MNKISMMKIGGFIGTLAAGAALVGSAVTGTGAWFSDSHDGTISAKSGHLTLNATDLHLSYADLVPGEDQTRNITYNVDANGKSDVWMVFDTTSLAYAKFSGASGATEVYPDGGLGRYGHFAVSNNGGNPLFESYNLKNAPAGTPNDQSCFVNANGDGGSATRANSETDTPPYCGVPGAILIASDLSSGQGGVMNVTFGVTGKWTPQNATVAGVPFSLVATQAGHRPGAANF